MNDITLLEFAFGTLTLSGLITGITQWVKNAEKFPFKKIPYVGQMVQDLLDWVTSGDPFAIRSFVTFLAMVFIMIGVYLKTGNWPIDITCWDVSCLKQMGLYLLATGTTVWEATANYTFFVKPRTEDNK